MSFFGVQLNSQVNRLVLEIRLKLAQNKVNPNFRTISRAFINYDPQSTGLVSPTLFEKALNDNGLFFKKFEIQAFEKAFSNENGLVNWEKFLIQLKQQPMNLTRSSIVQEIFNTLSNGCNEVAIGVLRLKFNKEGCDSFQKVVKNSKNEFDTFVDLITSNKQSVSRQEFLAFYDDLSINFPSDEAFTRYAFSQWNCQEKKLEKLDHEELRSVLKAFRFKLIQKTNGTKDEFLLTKIFNEFDQNKSQSIGSYELDLMLKKLELPTPARLIQPLLEQLDKNRSGCIEYDEFKKFLFFDPFTK